MRRVLEHFWVDGSYGWNQDWFTDLFMRLGGCAAVTACDSCVYFALRRGMGRLVPFDAAAADPKKVSRGDYLKLARKMKPHLHPRMRGIDRLEIYQDGMGAYLREVGETGLTVGALHGDALSSEAEQQVVAQIDNHCPIPFLTLRHKDPALNFYEWHWYLLMGYDRQSDATLVQAVTYGHTRWMDLRNLWDTGFEERGGMILFQFS